MSARFFIFSSMLLSLSLSLPLQAEEAEPPMPVNAEERTAMQAQVEQMKQDAEQRRLVANQTHEAAKLECWKKFLVSSCLEEARQVFRKEESQIRQIERDTRLIERNLKRYDAAARTAAREAENARKDAELERKSGKTQGP